MPSSSAAPRLLLTRTGSGVLFLALVCSLITAAVLAAPSADAARAAAPWPRYQPQSTCSPTPKRGTLELASHLMRRYPGSGSSGISRACSSGGVSEHKEGRAFDWRVNANVGRERRYAADFLQRLRRVDRHGHRAALARSMGVMYVIWNDHIYSSSSGYRKRDYVHYACSSARSCSPTLQHRDHMHISLSWAGARANTRWYAGDRTSPDAVRDRDRDPQRDRDRDREREQERDDQWKDDWKDRWEDDPTWDDEPLWQDDPIWEGHPVFGDRQRDDHGRGRDSHPVWGDVGPPGHRGRY